MSLDNAVAEIQSAAVSAAAFAAAAKAGEFAVNESGGQALVNAVRKMRDWIEDQEFELYQLAQEPRLGSSNGAKVMKPYMVKVATDANGFLTQLMAFRDSLYQTEDAILLAMSNYRTVDEQIAGKYTGGE